MTKELIQKLADSEKIDLNDDLIYLEVHLSHWHESVCSMFGAAKSEKDTKEDHCGEEKSRMEKPTVLNGEFKSR